ncbi:MAG: peptide chain release factor N(5)-glutamine methyltransferase [Prosthecobacter sp.]|jgi:release factor glutamine methyltransferase|uniref:peptide chain release factor N(5)-glutamine methyltransferase n=1 Tax=Prosthecobacter sp. TaxID=1965333 RepID=UPI001A08236D|nr:peptide chain release factor N(5)-glutamine methyltransferase [Prosthecobacter sp.]MBE2283516.1 peptide chain release factor N(5)-glutamine methyltransferase [Prosthecobacter sp.]
MKPLLEILQSGAAYLEKRQIEEARLNMEHLLAHVLGCRRLDLYLRFNENVPETDLVSLRELLRRRGEGEPLQHLLGTVEFCGHELVCDHRALVPRPETETLVELVLKKSATAPARVLDMATGSGCIGLSLAKAWPGSDVVLADISEDALDLARLNASRLGVAAKFIRSDLFEKITATFDLIVANLPYIPSAELPTLSVEVRRDPMLALDGGPDGLRIVERFLQDALPHLNPGALIALEVGHDQGPAVATRCTELGYEAASTAPDLAGIHRFVFAVTPQATAAAAV